MKQLVLTMCGAIGGGLIGAVLGFALPIGFAFAYVWAGGDPTGAGAVWILSLVGSQFGLVIGGIGGGVFAHFAYESRTPYKVKRSRRRRRKTL